MKTLKTLAAALLMFLSFSSFAADETKSEKLLMDYTVKIYIDAVSHGKMKGLSQVLDSDAKFTFTRNNEIYNYGKRDYLEFLKSTENIEQNCVTKSSIIDLNSTQSIVKVMMQYEGFTKIVHISLAKTSEGWKITNISNSFL